MNNLRFTAMEKAYAKQYVKANKRLLIVGMILLFLCMSDLFFPGQAIGAIVQGVFNLDYGYRPHSYVNVAQLIGCVCALSFILPLYQFRFLMKRSSSDLYLSLPIKRERFFYVQFILGVGILVGTTSVMSLGNIVLYNFTYSNGIFGFSPGIVMALLLFLIIEVLGVCLYSFYTWICMKCNTLLDAIVVMGCYTIIPIMIQIALSSFTSGVISKSLLAFSHYDMSAMSSSSLSDIVWIFVGLISVPWLMRSTTQMFSGSFVGIMFTSSITFGYIISFLVWIVFGVMFFHLAKQSFKKRKSEESEFKTKGYLTYPVVIPAITICLLLVLGVYESTLIWVFVVFVLYMGMQFFANRKILLTGSIFMKFICILVLVIGVEFCLIRTNVFGTVLEYPKQEDIQAVEVGIIVSKHQENTTIWESQHFGGHHKDQKGIQTILDEHKKLVSHSEKERSMQDAGYSINFNYLFANGDRMHRSYRIKDEDKEIAETLLQDWIEQGLIDDGNEYLNYGVD